MSVFFIRNKEEADRDFDEVAPLLQRCIDKAVHGEYDLRSLRDLVERKKIAIIGWRDEGKPAHFAFAIEFFLYPTGKTTANVLALGGCRMREAWDKELLPGLIRFLKMAGATELECQVSPAMQRLLLSFSKSWKETYRCLRLEI